MNINEGHVGEEVYVPISYSPSSHARPSVHMPEITLSCVLKIPALYSIFWQGKIPGGVGTFQQHDEQVSVLLCDRLTPLGEEGTNMY